MNLVKIVNQYIDTDNSEIILQGDNGKYYGLHQELSGCTSYKEIKDIADILTIDHHLDISPKSKADGPYLRAYKQYFGTDKYHTTGPISVTEDIAKLVTFVRDMHIQCERLASQYDGENLLSLLLAAAYIGKAEGINETIAKHNEQFKSEQ